MAQMQQSRSRQEVLVLQRVLEEAHAARTKELRDAGRVRWNGVVLWGPPGAEGCEREECEWDGSFSL